MGRERGKGEGDRTEWGKSNPETGSVNSTRPGYLSVTGHTWWKERNTHTHMHTRGGEKVIFLIKLKDVGMMRKTKQDCSSQIGER